MPPKTVSTDEASRWSDLAADYETYAEPLTGQYARAALAMVSGIKPGAQVLDVAAGTGALSLLLAEEGAHVLATDLSPGMVARLSSRLAAYPGCVARVMDGQKLDTPDGAFDVTFSIFGIMLFPDWRQGLRELARSTRRDGQGCVAVWRDPRGAGPFVLLGEALRSTFPDRDAPAISEGMTVLSSPKALEKEMEAAGFHGVEVRSADGAWSGPSVEEFMTLLGRLYRFAPFYAELDQIDRDRLRPALREAAERYASEGIIRVPSTALIAVGRQS